MIDVTVTVFQKCLNATIPLTCTLANNYAYSNEMSKKNGTVRGDCIACDALFDSAYLILIVRSEKEKNICQYFNIGPI